MDGPSHTLDTPEPIAQTVLLDGVIGGGKGMFCHILASWPNVSMWQHKPELEQLLDLVAAEEVTKSVGEAWVRHWVNEWWFNLQIGRNLNFNLSDQSSVWFDPRRYRISRAIKSASGFKKRMSEGDFPSKNEMLLLMTHGVSHQSEVLFDALNHRLKFIRLSRTIYTTYIVDQMARHVSLWDNKDPRHQKFLYGYKGNNVPLEIKDPKWFCLGNQFDKAVKLLWLNKVKGDEVLSKLSKKHPGSFLDIEFETFVLDPTSTLVTLSDFLDSTPDKVTHKQLKKQRVPRDDITDAPTIGKAAAVYKNLGWRAPKSKNDLNHYKNDAVKFVRENCSDPESVSLIRQLNGL